MAVEILNLTEFNPVGKFKNKKQILLTHTTRNLKDYISSLKYRRNGDNKKLPHYLISREGEVYQVIPPDTYSRYMDVQTYNKQNIIISLENLGWLKKNLRIKHHFHFIYIFRHF